MANKKRPIAMGIASHGVATVGDGVPGTDFTTLPLPLKNAVSFAFADPTEVRIDTEGSTDPLYSVFVKDTTDYIELSIPTPSNDVVHLLAGGTLAEDGDEWREAFDGVPEISKTYQCETIPRNGTKVVYTIVNARVVAKFADAPTTDSPEVLMVRFYKNAAISSSGTQGYAFSRKVVDVT